MKLAAKLAALLVIVVLVVLAIEAYLGIRRERALLAADMRRDASVLGKALSPAVEALWRDGGERKARRLIERANRGKQWVRIRWVWLDDRSIRRDFPSVPLARLGPALRGGIHSVEARGGPGSGHLYTYVPLEVGSPTRKGALELSESLSVMDEFASAGIRRRLLLFLVLVCACSVTLVLLGIRVVGRPLAALVRKTRRVALGDLSGPLALRRRDELGELATAMNQMCEDLSTARQRVEAETSARIEAMEELRHADRLRSVGTLAAGVAHELGTPLNIVSARADLVASGKLSDTDVEQNAAIIKAQAVRMTAIIRQILGFARRTSGTRVIGDLSRLAAETVELMRTEARTHSMTLQLASKSVHAEFDREQVRQVLANLIANAIQASPEGSQIDIGVAPSPVVPPVEALQGAEQYAVLFVQDRGDGIAKKDLPHVFEPFFTTKDVGSGTGLGLSVAHGIVADHGGWIEVESQPGQGSCFSVYLPRVPSNEGGQTG